MIDKDKRDVVINVYENTNDGELKEVLEPYYQSSKMMNNMVDLLKSLPKKLSKEEAELIFDKFVKIKKDE